MGLLHNPAMPNLLSRVFDGGRNIVNWMSITLNGFNNGIWIYSTNISNTKYWLFPGILLGAFGTRYAFVILKDNYFTRDHLQVILSKIATSKAVAAFKKVRKLENEITDSTIELNSDDKTFAESINSSKDNSLILRYIQAVLNVDSVKKFSSVEVRKYNAYRREFFRDYNIDLFIQLDSVKLGETYMNETMRLYISMFHEILHQIKQVELNLLFLGTDKSNNCNNTNKNNNEEEKKDAHFQIKHLLCIYMSKIDKSHGISLKGYYLVPIYPIHVISFSRIENALKSLMLVNINVHSDSEAVSEMLLNLQVQNLKDLFENLDP